MKPTVQSTKRCRTAPGAAAVPVAAWRGPSLNALKHGLRSGHVLLPGDNVADFRALRTRLFHFHRPRTIAEARCVETLAANEWRIARCRLEQAFFKRHLGVAMSGHPDTAGSLCSPDLHRLHHRCADCSLEERRLEKSMSQAETTLALLQQQRTQNFTVGGVSVLEDHTVFLAEGEPVVEEDGDVETPSEAPSAEAAETAATDSADGEISIGNKGTLDSRPRRFPKDWSPRRRRKAALRREAALRRAGKLPMTETGNPS